MRHAEKVSNKVIVDISFITKKGETANGSIPFVSHLGCPMSRYILVFAISFENKWKNTQKKHFPHGPIPLVSPILRTSDKF